MDTPLEISVTETAQLLRSGEGVFLLDVREPDEFAHCSISGATLIPMREIPARIGELPADKHILVQCHHGGRSMRVTQFLRSNGLRASNVAGGIDAWSLEVDSQVPRY